MMKRFVSCFALAVCLGILAGCTGSSTTSKPAGAAGTVGPKGGGKESEKKAAPTESVGNVPPPPK